MDGGRLASTRGLTRDVLSRLQSGEVDGVLPPICCALNIPGFVLDLMPAKRIPAMFDSAFWTERGAFASYGQDFYEQGRQAARLVDKILKGQKPGEIPVEVNSKLEFVINLKTAQTMGLTIAPEVCFRRIGSSAELAERMHVFNESLTTAR
jgi:putative ABC transport system substrate-binding protein